MKREIKFRALRLDNFKWAYGYLEYNYRYETSFIHTTSGVIDDRFVVDSKTVGQFTGLKDSNGVDIYEGDILSNNYNCRGAVRYINGMFLVDMKYDESILTNDADEAAFRLVSVASISVVIGNIHKNKSK